ncbi:translocase of chloroplast 108, chloroplastic [Magnolia sinica]|uniref:translocase of chloroplast 108, chloroplastic n=1 Tax=Magnolia sinica TaxID=86752 RepID=UPI002659349B|nr:translocase of chloroplast 108, chloroplastic [Magnolia sinica]
MASNPSASSLLIRAPPSLNSSDDEGGVHVEKKSTSSSESSSSSESETFHSGGEEEFETASERPFVGDPDEEILELAGSEADGTVPAVDSEVGFLPEKTEMPIARVSGGDDGDDKPFDDDGFLGDVDGDDGVLGVVRVSMAESSRGDSVLGGGEKEERGDSLEGNSESQVPMEVGESVGNGSPVILAENPLVEESPVVEREKVESTEKENSAKGGDSAAGTKQSDSVAMETPMVESVVGKNSIPGSGSDEAVAAVKEPADTESVELDSGVEKTDEAVVDNGSPDKSFESAAATKMPESNSSEKLGVEKLENSDETCGGSDQVSAIAEEPENLKPVEADIGVQDEAVVGDGGSDKSSESTAAAAAGMPESDSPERLGIKESEKPDEAGDGSDHASAVVEELENLKSVNADTGVEVETEAVGIAAPEKQVGSATVTVEATSQSPGFEELKPASTGLVVKSDKTGSESDQTGHIIEEELVNSNSFGAETGLAKNIEAVDDGGSDENHKSVTTAVVETTPQSDFHEKAGLEESEPASTDSVAKSNETGSGSNQVGHVIEEELVNLNAVGAKTIVAEENAAVGDGGSDKNLESITTAVVETTPQSNSHKKVGLEEPGLTSTDLVAKSNETDGGSNQVSSVNEEAADSKSELALIDSGVKPNEPEPETGDDEHGRYEMQTANFIDNKPIESNLDKEAQPLVADSEDPETDKEILESSSGIPIVNQSANARNEESEDGIPSSTHIPEREVPVENLSSVSVSADPELKWENEHSRVEGDGEEVDKGASETVERIIREIEQGSSSSQLGLDSSRDHSQRIDGQIVSDSDEEVETDEEGDGKELFDSAALAALLKAASSAAPDDNITITAPGASRFFSVERPAGLGSSVPSLKPSAPRANRPNVFTPSNLAVVGEPENNMDEEEKKLHEKIQQIRVKFLRLVQRLGHAPEDTVAEQVLYRLDFAEGLKRGRQTNRFSLESARKTAMQLETAGKDDLNFSCNILILGKIGVGKSATVNSIFGEVKTPISAFEPATSGVKEIIGTVDGVKIRIIDTPGLRASVMDQNSNRKILSSIKKFMKKCPPDIVLYIDRLDTQTRDFNDLPLLRSISSVLGPSIWLNAIVALTHAASAPPDGPNGSPLSYEVFVAQRSHIVQHSIRQAAGDMRLMNPVALAENHPSCRRNREGERVLPNGQNWRPQLLLLCYSSKILSEANSLLKLQDQSAGKLFGFRIRSPPLPFLLSSLLQSRAHPKLSNDMGGESVDSDIDLDDLSDSDREEEEDEYDQLPPFKPLKKAQIAKLSKEQKKAYFDEYDYRVKLLQKKQWKEELQRLRESKKRGKDGRDDFGYGDMGEDYDQENGSPAAVPVPLPDMALPPSFDGDNPAYRYRFLEPTSQLLARPVLDTHGWDHDCGYDGVSLEESLAIIGQFPAAVSVQITKDKKEFNIHLDSSVSAKHGENGSTMAGFDIQSVGKQLAYILRGETKFRNFKKNKTTAGASITFLGENVATGLKIEDQISIGKRVNLVASTGAVRAQGDVAYGANLEARLRDKDFPIGQDQSTLGLSLMRWRGDLALGANLQSQFSIGRNSKMAVRVGLNNKLSGQITVRTSSSEQLQIALMGIIPIAAAVIRTFWPGESYIVH